jgi:uncharacterized DUF497 family protein
MMLEWDEAKRLANLRKHGVAFAKAEEFDWEGATAAPDLRFDYGEKRVIAFGEFRGRLHVMIYVERDGRKRLISFRPANAREVRRHEEQKTRP